MKSLLCLILAAVINIANGEQSSGGPNYNQPQNTFTCCRIKSNQIGYCVMIDNCPQFANHNLTNSDLELLGQYKCGSHNNSSLVCCTTLYDEIKTIFDSNTPSELLSSSSTPQSTENVPSANDLLPTPRICGGDVSGKIYGGNATPLGGYPWMALLEYTRPGNVKSFRCGGFLINKRYILTAAHCVHSESLPFGWRLTGVRLGEWDLDSEIDCEDGDCSDPVKNVLIEEEITHEDYVPCSIHQANDIALLRLAEEVQYTSWIKPICLPQDEDLRNNSFVGYSMDVAGWGRTETSRQSNLLLKATLNVVDNGRCDAVYAQKGVVLRESQLCAGGDKGIDSCVCDSGGPLIGVAHTAERRPYFFSAGIVSFGTSPCGIKNFPGVYSRVTSFVDWIKSNLRP